jgi:hypothetical protein
VKLDVELFALGAGVILGGAVPERVVISGEAIVKLSVTDGLPEGRGWISLSLVALRSVVIPDMNIEVTEVVLLREAVAPFTGVGVYVVDWLDVGLITPTPPVGFIIIVFPEITPETPPETIEVDIKAVSFMDAAVPLDGTAEAAVEGLKAEGVVTPMPPAEFIVENPPAAVSDDDEMSTELVDAVLFKGVGTYVAADAVELSGEPEGVKLMEDIRPIVVVWVVV